MRFGSALVSAAAIVCLIVLSGCSRQPILGVLAPVSGEAAAYGQAVTTGIAVAMDEAEEKNGLPAGFDYVEIDTTSSPAFAAAEYRRMVRELDVRLVVGGVTTVEARALLPAVNDERILCISPSAAASEVARQSPYFYRIFTADEVEGRIAARHLHENADATSLAVVTDDSIFSRELETEFRQHYELKLGGKIVGTIHLGSERWRQEWTDIFHAREPKAVYVVGHAERILEVLRAVRESGFPGVRCTTSTFFLANILRNGGEDIEGVFFPLPVFDSASQSEPVMSFVERYQSRYGLEPDIFAAHGYDAARLAIHTLNSSRTLHTTDFRRVMSFGLQDLVGVTGPIAFDDYGEVRRYPIMHCVWKGRVVTWKFLQDERKRAIEEILRGLRGSPTPTPVSTPSASA